MAAKLPWIQRRWRFDFPVGLYPDILERLRGVLARMEENVAGISKEVLTRREGTTWSIQENIGHLLDLEPIMHGRLDDYLAGATVLRAADMTNRKTHEANHNARPIAELLSEFRRQREALCRRLDHLAEADFGRTAQHPRLKIPMRMVDWMLFTADHDDYHITRMTELKQLFLGMRPS